MFGETTISYVKIGNHPIETTIYKWLFGVPGWNAPCPVTVTTRIITFLVWDPKLNLHLPQLLGGGTTQDISGSGKKRWQVTL